MKYKCVVFSVFYQFLLLFVGVLTWFFDFSILGIKNRLLLVRILLGLKEVCSYFLLRLMLQEILQEAGKRKDLGGKWLHF